MLTLMRAGRTVAAIATNLGLEPEYARKATRRLAAAHGFNYQPQPNAEPAKLTSASAKFRNNMSAVVYDLRNAKGVHQVGLASKTGLTQKQQVLASQSGGLHDYTLSQLERLAAAKGADFTRMMIIALLDGFDEADKERTRKVLQCLNS